MTSRGGKYHRSDMSKQDGTAVIGLQGEVIYSPSLSQKEMISSLVLL
jgi:hypothetical protein